jgi:hypothetical protein
MDLPVQSHDGAMSLLPAFMKQDLSFLSNSPFLCKAKGSAEGVRELCLLHLLLKLEALAKRV